MDNMSIFGERLNELLFDRNISPLMVTTALNVSISTIYRWKNNQAKIMLSNLIGLANLLNCSIDFLFGRSDEILTFIPNEHIPPFSIRLREVMREKRLSTYSLRNSTRYDGRYFENWDHGSEPNSATLCELADILDCSIDYLVGRET